MNRGMKLLTAVAVVLAAPLTAAASIARIDPAGTAVLIAAAWPDPIDARVTRCSLEDRGGWISIEATNNTDVARDVSIEVEYRDPTGRRIGGGRVPFGSLAAGETRETYEPEFHIWDEILDPGPDSGSCVIVRVS